MGSDRQINENWCIQVRLKLPGCFDFYFRCDNVTSKRVAFMVYPKLIAGNQNIPIESICCFTILPKFLGSWNNWKESLTQIARCHYNVIHFTPVQKLGQSRSSYSLYHQLILSDQLLPDSDLPFLSSSSTTAIETVKQESLQDLINDLERYHSVLSISDVVWNHTSFDSPWLVDHPEATYNLDNSPHLIKAYELEIGLLAFNQELAERQETISSQYDLDRVMYSIEHEVLNQLKLWEFFVIDVNRSVNEFKEALKHHNDRSLKSSSSTWTHSSHAFSITNEYIIDDLSGKRHSKSIKISAIVDLLIASTKRSADGKIDKDACIEQLTQAIHQLNVPYFHEYDRSIREILNNLRNSISYRFVDSHGPRLGVVKHSEPIISPYFRKITSSAGQTIVMATNGWIWGGDPRVDFASNQSNAYFFRQVINWSDSIKLRYGNRPEENPWLWQHMREYTEMTARLFHGIRIDNCHSTPIHVAQYLLDSARRIRPNLLVVAELFTNSLEQDILFKYSIGIHLFIREAMEANNVQELFHQVAQCGGNFVGSINRYRTIGKNILMDCTHDNQLPNEKRAACDSLPNSAIVSMAVSSIGSTLGYDIILAKKLDIVSDSRRLAFLDDTTGIVAAKKVLNQFHVTLEQEGFSELYGSVSNHAIGCFRHNPSTHDCFFMATHHAFNRYDFNQVPSFDLPCSFKRFHYYAMLDVPFQSNMIPGNSELIHGLRTTLLQKIDENPHRCRIENDGKRISFNNLVPGSVIIVECGLDDHQQQAIAALRAMLSPNDLRLVEHLRGVDLIDLNVLLFRCDQEERDTIGRGTYDIPGYGRLPFCGLAGVMPVLRRIHDKNDLAHPLCDNLRAGDWFMEYQTDRLGQRANLKAIQIWLNEATTHIRILPRFLVPRYVYDIINRLYEASCQRSIDLMSDFIKHGDCSGLVHQLAISSIQLFGCVPSAPMKHDVEWTAAPSLAAGLPHFSTGFMRCWGRDTFISLRGLFLVTGRFEEALEIIKAFACCQRHGLIPNLLDSGRNPRYNARDSVWWFLQALQDYSIFHPQGMAFLKQTHVDLIFDQDISGNIVRSCQQKRLSLEQIIQQIMQAHATGIHFREYNAGKQIDELMSHDGFKIDIELDTQTGFIHGGNLNNCGTWMDKMGSSRHAGNYSMPATPRDGAAIEIVGLLKSTVRWLSEQYASGNFAFDGVLIDKESKLTYSQWNDQIQRNFEKCFFIPEIRLEDMHHELDEELINCRGIYKDLFGSAQPWTDYQFRPNICVAMAVAPEMFQKTHASVALDQIDRQLLGPLGIKTLSPHDQRYRGHYNPDDSSGDHFIAGGYNYHQGPEWLWLMGFYLRARINFNQEPLQLVYHQVHSILQEHRRHLCQSSWLSLPELTNANGAHCHASCDSQAWSIATILDALHLLSTLPTP